jgi:hypothetical protein
MSDSEADSVVTEGHLQSDCSDSDSSSRAAGSSPVSTPAVDEDDPGTNDETEGTTEQA